MTQEQRDLAFQAVAMMLAMAHVHIRQGRLAQMRSLVQQIPATG
jgi:hypothetical protein